MAFFLPVLTFLKTGMLRAIRNQGRIFRGNCRYFAAKAPDNTQPQGALPIGAAVKGSKKVKVKLTEIVLCDFITH